jgi:hypothetical protein
MLRTAGLAAAITSLFVAFVLAFGGCNKTGPGPVNAGISAVVDCTTDAVHNTATHIVDDASTALVSRDWRTALGKLVARCRCLRGRQDQGRQPALLNHGWARKVEGRTRDRLARRKPRAFCERGRGRVMRALVSTVAFSLALLAAFLLASCGDPCPSLPETVTKARIAIDGMQTMTSTPETGLSVLTGAYRGYPACELDTNVGDSRLYSPVVGVTYLWGRTIDGSSYTIPTLSGTIVGLTGNVYGVHAWFE